MRSDIYTVGKLQGGDTDYKKTITREIVARLVLLHLLFVEMIGSEWGSTDCFDSAKSVRDPLFFAGRSALTAAWTNPPVVADFSSLKKTDVSSGYRSLAYYKKNWGRSGPHHTHGALDINRSASFDKVVGRKMIVSDINSLISNMRTMERAMKVQLWERSQAAIVEAQKDELLTFDVWSTMFGGEEDGYLEFDKGEAQVGLFRFLWNYPDTGHVHVQFEEPTAQFGGTDMLVSGIFPGLMRALFYAKGFSLPQEERNSMTEGSVLNLSLEGYTRSGYLDQNAMMLRFPRRAASTAPPFDTLDEFESSVQEPMIASFPSRTSGQSEVKAPSAPPAPRETAIEKKVETVLTAPTVKEEPGQMCVRVIICTGAKFDRVVSDLETEDPDHSLEQRGIFIDDFDDVPEHTAVSNISYIAGSYANTAIARGIIITYIVRSRSTSLADALQKQITADKISRQVKIE